MCKAKKRIYHVDDDTLEVCYCYNQELKMFFGNYPDFSEEPRYTPNGRPWVNAMFTDCPHSPKDYGDCGTCKYFLRENPRDLIGVCLHEALRKEHRL